MWMQQPPTPPPVACARPNVAASVIHAAPAVASPLADQQGIHGVVQVVVTLDADSRIVGAAIRSSPSAELNRAAIAAARQSTYQTEIRDCRPIAASYIVPFEFVNKVTFATSASGEQLLSVIGTGVVTRPADSAEVRTTIVTRDPDAARATAKNDALFDALKAKLAALGIPERVIGWTLSVWPRASATPAPSSEYSITRAVEIPVDNVADAGHVAAAAASLTLSGTVAIRYELENRVAANREALAFALKDAENAAQRAASGQQWHLGVLRSVTPPASARSPSLVKIVPYFMVPVVGGFKEPELRVPEIEVGTTATVTYAVKP
jgi:uncharacterized protein YggE